MSKAWRENLLLAVGTINSHKMRSGLTILGVVIGVTCVISIGAILTGMNRSIVGAIQDLGTDNIAVSQFSIGLGGPRSRDERLRRPISWHDFETVRQSCPSCRNYSINLYVRGIDHARYKDVEFHDVEFRGTLPSYPDVERVPVGRGRFFTEAENQHASDVCVIGSDVVKTFFPNVDALGKQILVNGHTFTVIGEFEPKKSPVIGENSQNRNVIVPYETYRKVYPLAKDHFLVIAAQPGKVAEAMDEIRVALRRSRRVAWSQPDNFGINTPTALIEQFHQITGATALVLVVISSIGLLVGGVGVMNIMLVSVTERTREIGVRKAIGARRRDITLQFLLEAGALTGVGGLLGILLGVAITFLVDLAMPRLEAVVPLWAVIVGFAMSVSVGLFFGLWPAMKAARLDPVEALRYE
jgi:ABC-type antimicrobial peptide transport system permease subunit